MDVGVGSFVFSSGIVAARAYIGNETSKESVMKSMMKSVRSAFPILVLGFARVVLTKGVNYQEHNSEYGLHWNFFFTLGFLPPFVTLIAFCRKLAPFSVLALVIACTYQFALCQGLQDWILKTPRIDLISANKEGICSFFGYLSIFLFGIQCGVIVFQNQDNISKSLLSRLLRIGNNSHIKQLTVHLYSYSAIMWLLFNTWIYLYPNYYVSRRMVIQLNYYYKYKY
jgi:phosphatidylinositol glycan class W